MYRTLHPIWKFLVLLLHLAGSCCIVVIAMFFISSLDSKDVAPFQQGILHDAYFFALMWSSPLLLFNTIIFFILRDKLQSGKLVWKVYLLFLMLFFASLVVLAMKGQLE